MPIINESLLEIEAMQLSRIYNHHTLKGEPRFFERAATKFYDEFLSKPLAGKLAFIGHCAFSIRYRIGRLFRRATANAAHLVGVKGIEKSIIDTIQDSPIKIALTNTGGLGDMIHVCPVIMRLHELYKPGLMHVYLNLNKMGFSEIVFSGMPYVKVAGTIEQLDAIAEADNPYDLIINVSRLWRYTLRNEGPILRHSPEFLKIIMESQTRFKNYQFMFDNHPIYDGLFGRLMGAHGLNVTEAAAYLAGVPVSRAERTHLVPGADAVQAVDRLGLGSDYITIHDGYDVHAQLSPGAERPTRVWGKANWEQLTKLLKREFPTTSLVQLGAKQSSDPIPGVDRHLISQLNMHEVAEVIRRARLHIDGESGLLYVAIATGVPTISIQGPTAGEYFQFDQMRPVRSDFCGSCWWVTDSWFSRCPRGFGRAECMHKISPEMVLSAVIETLDGTASPTRRSDAHRARS